MTDYKLTTRKECFQIIAEHHVPVHILKHCLAVTKIAVFLAERLKEKGIEVDIDLVERACLLHDIARVCDFKDFDYKMFEQKITDEDKEKWRQIRTKYKDISHEDAAFDILKGKYPKLAMTIKRHAYIAVVNPGEGPKTWEEKLCLYADMRVSHDKIVPLKKRLNEAHKRNVHLHGSEEQSKIVTARIDPVIFELEEEIFGKIDLDPLEVTEEFIGKSIA